MIPNQNFDTYIVYHFFPIVSKPALNPYREDASARIGCGRAIAAYP